jgi:omega-hydroxy-beta-dihydromenaquinone-9 sulfotransferase
VPPPVFILGIWRSGTTHLHNLLSQDDRFAFPNTYQVFYPHSFLCTESWNAPNVKRFLPSTRPMDDVRNGIEMPQEDEFALAASGLSFLIGAMAFPRTGRHYRRFLTLRGATQYEIDAWKSNLMRFLQKLTLKHDRPLLLKSPGHTSRIKLLLELFPDAKFVHIHRHPHAVFQSSVHTMKKAMPFCTLQSHDHSIEQTIQDYADVFDAFFEQRHLIPVENFCEVAFEQLEQDPIGELRRIYQTLALPDFSGAESRVRDYTQSLKAYSKNSFPDLPADLRARLAQEWRRCFEQWGYVT